MPKYYFTFGANHTDKNGVSLGNRYCVIEAPEEGVARTMMAVARGMKWAFSYPESLFAGQAEKFGLKEVKLADIKLPQHGL